MSKSVTTAHRRLVGINQASEYADVNPKTIRRWIAAGRIPAYRVGPRLLKIDLNEMELMLHRVPTVGGDV